MRRYLDFFCKTIDRYQNVNMHLFCSRLGDGLPDIYLPRMIWAIRFSVAKKEYTQKNEKSTGVKLMGFVSDHRSYLGGVGGTFHRLRQESGSLTFATVGFQFLYLKTCTLY